MSGLLSQGLLSKNKLFAYIEGKNTKFRYFKWAITKRRSTGDSIVQVSELKFYNDGVLYTFPVGVLFSQGEGTIKTNEEPWKIGDGSVDTKWLHSSFGSSLYGTATLIIDLGINNKIRVTSYEWYTANDITQRDPVSWILYGSNDNANWIELDRRDDQTITTSRKTLAGKWDINY